MAPTLVLVDPKQPAPTGAVCHTPFPKLPWPSVNQHVNIPKLFGQLLNIIDFMPLAHCEHILLFFKFLESILFKFGNVNTLRVQLIFPFKLNFCESF
jgi:hypothetical protein